MKKHWLPRNNMAAVAMATVLVLIGVEASGRAACPPGEVEVDVFDARNEMREDNLFWPDEIVKLKARITCTDVKKKPAPTYAWSQPSVGTSRELSYTASASSIGLKTAEVCATGRLENGRTFNYSGANTFIVTAIETEVNNTSVTTDDIVRERFKIPRVPEHRFTTPCQTRVNGNPPKDVAVTLYSSDNRLRFPNSQREQNYTLKKDGTWESFYISGQSRSDSVGDAIIETHKDTSSGQMIGTKKCTVFGFSGSINALPLGTYVLRGGFYAPAPPEPAVILNAHATVIPSGVSIAAPQVANLRIGIAQSAQSTREGITVGSPMISWNAVFPIGYKSSAPAQLAASIQFLGRYLDQTSTPGPGVIYDATAWGNIGAAIHARDFPYINATGVRFLFPSRGGTVTYTPPLEGAYIQISFTDWCVTYDPVTGEIYPLRQTSWFLNVGTQSDVLRTAIADPDDAAVSTLFPQAGSQLYNSALSGAWANPSLHRGPGTAVFAYPDTAPYVTNPQ